MTEVPFASTVVSVAPGVSPNPALALVQGRPTTPAAGPRQRSRDRRARAIPIANMSSPLCNALHSCTKR